MLNIFLGASQPFGIPQLRILCLAQYSIFNRIIWFPGVQLLEYFILDIGPPIRLRIGKDLFPIGWLPFCLIDSIFCPTEALQFYEVPFVVS